MEQQHTPGPWQCYADLPSTEPDWHIVTSANRMRVLANVHIEPGNATDKANARLIAAAPELLAALEIFERRVFDNGEWDDGCFYYHGTSASELQEPLRLARAAIAKAKGR